MSSYRQLLYHLVFRTRESLPTIFPSFNGWADGYGSFTCSYSDLASLVDYIKNQKEHHRKKSFEDEYRSLLIESGVEINERYFP
jgi:putative transposase